MPIYRAVTHHHTIAARLEAVEQGEIDRLLICMPPRHGKSELASRRFPAWFLGKQPMRSVIAASYNSDLASDFGRQVRNVANSREFGVLFDMRLAEDSRAANRWNTEQGGAYYAAGVGTAVTGRGADVLLIDDPFKDREEADSELRRDRVWEWYRSTAYTRLAPGGRIVLIQTRWHEDDLAGRLLDEAAKGGDQWETLILPAISDAGEALWPESYPLAVLERHRRAIGPRDWSALYQQRPAPDEGVYFKREWFRWYDTKPKHLRIYGASDYAVTEGGGDYTVHGIGGVDPDDNLFILDVWRRQTESHVWVETFLDLVKQYQPLTWGEEDGQILKSIGPFIDRRMHERRIYCHREQFVTVRDKPTRCRSFQARASQGKVYLPRDAPWLDAFLTELLTFPAGRFDDQVDMCGLFGRLLDQMVGAHVPKIAEPNYLDEYRSVVSRDEGADSWKTA